MKRDFLVVLLILLGNAVGLAQTKIGGVVLDKTGQPIPYANVVFQNTTIGTITDENGKFELESSDSHSSAVFSFIGFKELVKPLLKATELDLKIVLEEEAATLNAVQIFKGKTSKKDNPALVILKKIQENRRRNGVNTFAQYEFQKYEKLEFDINKVDSSLMKLPIFKGMDFIFDYSSTNTSGTTYLPVFINESVSKVYGDNINGKKREELIANKNAGFSENQNLIAIVKDLYDEYDIYDNYLKIFDKSFVSPLASTGIHNYNYVLADSAYIDNKWCYNIVYYPRRKNELTFSGDFWVNDTTWAIKKIRLEADKSANINWVRDIQIEQEFDVLNDSVFLMTRDFFMADFALVKKEGSKGVFAKRTSLYEGFNFEKAQEPSFYSQKIYELPEGTYNKDEAFWARNRIEELNEEEKGIYVMLDSLTKVKSFNRLYEITTALQSGYIEGNGWDYGPIYSTFGYNEVEGIRLRAGARTYFGQHDKWRIEGYGAYGFEDEQFKYGISAKWMVDSKMRLIISGGNRRDIEQLGANLTNTVDVLGRSLASSSLLNVGDNDKLSSVNLSAFAVEMEPFTNFTIRTEASYRTLKSASPTFNFDYYVDEARTQTASEVAQTEVSAIFTYTPGRETSGYGVERMIVNDGRFPTFFLNFTQGLQDVLDSDFKYEKLQFYYNQPLLIGSFGRANASVEAGKLFGEVPLGLLNVVPGNQSFFALYNSFPVLDFYEFVTDTYVAVHFEHNFNGRFFSRIPLIRKLNLRELVGIRGVWGELSDENIAMDASGLALQAPTEGYWEYSAGIGNILKLLRVDAHFRGNYLEDPKARNFAVTATLGFHF